MRDSLPLIVSGALIMGYLTASTFFLHFYKQTSDRLFAYFSSAFLILAVQRLLLALTIQMETRSPWLYGLRLVAFLIILAAIIDKNRAR